MSRPLAARERTRDPVATAYLHAALRFATGATAAFVLAEYMQWSSSYLPALFFATLITMLPGCPPLKVGAVLVAATGVAALTAFLLVSVLRGAPSVLVGLIGLIVFVAFLALADNRAKLPALLFLICMSTVPIVGIVSPANADQLPRALVRGVAVAVVIIWGVYAIWPMVLPKAARAAPPPTVSPLKSAFVGTMIVMPLMLVYLLFGWSDVLPVMTSTVVLVTNLDPREGAAQGVYRSLGSLVGGLIAVVAFLLLAILPTLTTLALILFLIGLGFAPYVQKGGAQLAMALQVFNSAMIILGKAIGSPDNSAGLWLTRVTEFAIAGLFAVGMMYLFLRKK